MGILIYVFLLDISVKLFYIDIIHIIWHIAKVASFYVFFYLLIRLNLDLDRLSRKAKW
jgi:predicted tellurium resistance membrane protein TerC